LVVRLLKKALQAPFRAGSSYSKNNLYTEFHRNIGYPDLNKYDSLFITENPLEEDLIKVQIGSIINSLVDNALLMAMVSLTSLEMKMAITNEIFEFLLLENDCYTYIGNCYKIEINNKDCCIDLLFFHRKLKSLILVLIDSSVEKLKYEYPEDMELLLSAVNEKIKLPGENPSIGLHIFKSAHQTEVTYYLKNPTAPIEDSSYIPTQTLPLEIVNNLPDRKRIIENLKDKHLYFDSDILHYKI